MALLPTESGITSASTTNAQQKLNFAAIRNFLADLLGTDSADKEAARAALGAVGNTGDETIAGIKTFFSSPVLPTPASADDSTKGATTAWVRDNMVGTVSQSVGEPTGAIIERGSNANGEYAKYADGTLICWKKDAAAASTAINTAYGAIYRSASKTITFAHAFVSADISVDVTVPDPNGGIMWATLVGNTASDVTIYTVSPASVTLNIKHAYKAIGRWY